MNNNAPVGFFDSGVGGLSVFSQFRKLLPNENTIYFGDLKNLPYGNKSKEELISFARSILKFFQSKNVKAVVIACNTSSALAYESIKNEFDFKIYPIIQSCAKVISSMNNIKKIGVFATTGTVSSKVYTREIKKYNSELEVLEIACPNWVSIVEGNENNKLEDVRYYMNQMLEFNPDKIILGCTHYPYLIDILTMFAPKEIFIDPAEIFVEYIENDLNKNNMALPVKNEFYVSANPELFIKNSKMFYELRELPIVADLN